MKTFARRVSVLLLCLLMACVSGCESADDGQSTGHGDGLLTVSLAYSGGGWFRLQIFAPHPDHPDDAPILDGSRESEFDTNCLLNEASTFELTQLSEGDNRTILFEAFEAADCAASKRIATGLRGGVTISEEDPGRYFIPV